jgi:aminoglycoside phosphotransferase (APT) family kinase protein
MEELIGNEARRPHGADEPALHDFLSRIVAEHCGAGASIDSLRRDRLPPIGSYDCETLTVNVDGGEQLVLFFKDFGFSRLSKDDRELRRVRELRVYQELLATAELGTPHYYGSLFDEQRERYWLLIELVEGTVVEEVDLRLGAPAVAWLARMQGWFLAHADKLAGCDFLIRHDADFFRAKAEGACRDVAQLCPASSGQLAELVGRYERVVDVMASAPRSLVHGGYIPWHVLVDTRRDPVRVAAVDWELAAFGTTLYDLAFFTDGVQPEIAQPLLATYREAATEYGVPLPCETEMETLIDCFRLHRILDWLSRSAEKEYPEQKVAKLVHQASALAQSLPV